MGLFTLGFCLGFWVLGWFWVWLSMSGPRNECRRPCGLMLMPFWGCVYLCGCTVMSLVGGSGLGASFVSVNSFVAYLAFRVDLGFPFVRCEGTWGDGLCWGFGGLLFANDVGPIGVCCCCLWMSRWRLFFAFVGYMILMMFFGFSLNWWVGALVDGSQLSPVSHHERPDINKNKKEIS